MTESESPQSPREVVDSLEDDLVHVDELAEADREADSGKGVADSGKGSGSQSRVAAAEDGADEVQDGEEPPD